MYLDVETRGEHMWDPGQYQRFTGERSRPFADLIARVGAEDPATVVDLGCGPGNLTAHLARGGPGRPPPEPPGAAPGTPPPSSPWAAARGPGPPPGPAAGPARPCTASTTR